jgi:hypothetical protein
MLRSKALSALILARSLDRYPLTPDIRTVIFYFKSRHAAPQNVSLAAL